MEKGINTDNKPLIHGLSKENFNKLSSHLKEDIIKWLKLSGFIKEGTSTGFKWQGLHIPTILAFCAIYGFIHFSNNPVRKDIARLDARQARFEKELIEIKTNQVRFEAEVKVNQAHFETELKEIKANQAHFETELKEIKTNVALILERLPKKD